MRYKFCHNPVKEVIATEYNSTQKNRMVGHVPFIVPVADITTLKTKIRLKTIGGYTQVQPKRKWLVVYLVKTAFSKESIANFVRLGSIG